MKFISKSLLTALAALNLALYLQLSATVHAGEVKTPIAGGWAWSIVPPFSGPGKIIPLPSGNVHLRDVAASGPISLTGSGIALEGILTTSISGNLDATLSGPLHGSTTLKSVIDGVETVIFEGVFTGKTVSLLTRGNVMLHGRGPCAGLSLHFQFVEVPPMNVYTFEGYLLKSAP